MEEQEKLELAYEEAVLQVRPLRARPVLPSDATPAQLDEFKRQHALDEVSMSRLVSSLVRPTHDVDAYAPQVPDDEVRHTPR